MVGEQVGIAVADPVVGPAVVEGSLVGGSHGVAVIATVVHYCFECSTAVAVVAAVWDDCVELPFRAGRQQAQ